MLKQTEELLIRIEKSFERLHDVKYQLHIPETRDQNGWPGDWEGRTILGLISTAKVLGKEPKYLNEILDFIFGFVGDKGYFGVITDAIDEQQLSGNSWFMRSMCELYLYNHDKRALGVIKNLITNLYLPLISKYNNYPINPYDRVYEGDMSGNISEKVVNGWKVSTDTGCAYIPLDGVTAAYEILLNEDKQLAEKLEALIKEMIENYKKIDFVGICVQTHATLSGLRGVLRYAKLKNDMVLVKFGEKVFDTYINFGMTENFENFNWFNRPTWTEPCAIVDSYICAVELWKFTKQNKYIDMAHYIYYNGIRSTQRVNGGFGCNSCATTENPELEIKDGEAYWCCTMRGADGLSYIANNSVIFEDNKAYIIGFFNQKVEFDNKKVDITTKYPLKGEVIVNFENVDEVIFYIPEWAVNVKKTKESGCIKLSFDILEKVVLRNSMKKLMRGPLILDENKKLIGDNLLAGISNSKHKILF